MNLPSPRVGIECSVLAQTSAEWLVVGVWEDLPHDPSISALDAALGGELTRLRESQDFQGKSGSRLTIYRPHNLDASRLLLVGLGKRADATRTNLHANSAAAIRSITGKAIGRVALVIPVPPPALPWSVALLAVSVAAIQAGSGPGQFKATPSRFMPADIALIVTAPWLKESQTLLPRVVAEGEAMILTRSLVDLPPSDLNPTSFANIALELGGRFQFGCQVLDDAGLREQSMGAILAVAGGSDQPARLVTLEYRAGNDRPTLALVGKGVTFDSGGLSIKTSEQMSDMKCDMAGAATVLATVCAVARLKLPINLLGILPLVENMTGGGAMKLGDVLRTRSGKTVEVLNTDAEGRLILADALSWAISCGADHLVDLATLTGACMVALGTEIVGVMGNHAGWSDTLRSAIQRAGERAWTLPMDADFGELLESQVADLKNIGPNRYGGAIVAAKFLEQFVEGRPWVHLDIAGPAWSDSGNASLDAGGTGAMVRSMIELAHSY